MPPASENLRSSRQTGSGERVIKAALLIQLGQHLRRTNQGDWSRPFDAPEISWGRANSIAPFFNGLLSGAHPVPKRLTIVALAWLRNGFEPSILNFGNSQYYSAQRVPGVMCLGMDLPSLKAVTGFGGSGDGGTIGNSVFEAGGPS